MNPIELGKFIANLRNEKNLTQEELAEKLYIDKKKVSRWECGTSIPEFELLIKLSEILDVSLYELSICKRINKEKLSDRIINRFKSIKDFKKYKAKKIIKITLISLLFIFFIIMTIYTFKYNNTVEVYELRSLDDNYYIEGNVVKIKSDYTINITRVLNNNTGDKIIKQTECKYEIYYNNSRIISSAEEGNIKDNKSLNNNIFKHTQDFSKKLTSNNRFTYKSKCNNSDNYSFDFELLKKYDNKLF